MNTLIIYFCDVNNTLITDFINNKLIFTMLRERGTGNFSISQECAFLIILLFIHTIGYCSYKF